MAFKLKSYKELVSMTKEKLDEALLPLRIRSAKAKAEGEVVRLEEKLIKLETEINEMSAKQDIDFNAIADKMDSYDLTERRLKQVQGLVEALFPTT